MKKIKFILLLLSLISLNQCEEDINTIKPARTDLFLVINEFMAKNDSICQDTFGEYDDWIEIYNTGESALNIGGMYFSDDPTNLRKSQIQGIDPEKTIIEPGKFLIIWADNDVEQGVLHLNFKLNGSGESIILTQSNGITVVDSISYDLQTTDISMGRSPNGTNNWIFINHPTPGESN